VITPEEFNERKERFPLIATTVQGGFSDNVRYHAAVPGSEYKDGYTNNNHYTSLCGRKYTGATTGVTSFWGILPMEQCQRCLVAAEKRFAELGPAPVAIEAPDVRAHRLATQVVSRLVTEDSPSIYNVVREVLIEEFSKTSS
jgi:hypothetical protein